MYFVANNHQKNFSRSVYSILDYLGDVGGLLDGLKLIASALIAPFSGYSYIAVLLTKLFSVQGENGVQLNADSTP